MISEFRLLADHVELPNFAGTRILQMPIIHGEPDSLPDDLANWGEVIVACAEATPQFFGQVVYLTVDEKVVEEGQTHRRPRLHVDGYHRTEHGINGGTWGGSGGTWAGSSGDGGKGTGLLTLSTPAGCKAWNQEFDGEPAIEGECEHLRFQCGSGEMLKANGLYWLAPWCVHESVPMERRIQRQFMRLSLPSQADWYEGCTVNPKGVLPTGKIMPQRRFLMV